MALTYGFFNSIEGDRKYSALEFGSIFDGIIEDGVYQSIGDKFKVTSHNVENDMRVYVGTGRAWFLHTWTLNTAEKAVTVPASEVLLPRIDALVLDIDHRENYRRNAFKIIKGTPDTNPIRPGGFANLPEHKEIPLAFITVPAKATYIRSADIVNVVGNVSQGGPPFVVGVLEVADLSTIYAHIEAQWDDFYSSSERQLAQIQKLYSNVDAQYKAFILKLDSLIDDAKYRVDDMIIVMERIFKGFLKVRNIHFNDFIDLKNTEFNEKMDVWDSSFSYFWTDFKQKMESYLEAQEDVWETWFRHIQGQLSDDAATNLQRQIDALSFVFILGERAVLGITASAIHEKVVFGTYGSVSGERVMISAPSRDSIWMFDEKAILSVIATVVHNRAIFNKYAGVTDKRVIISPISTWDPFVPVGEATTEGHLTDARFITQDDRAMFTTTKRACDCVKEE